MWCAIRSQLNNLRVLSVHGGDEGGGFGGIAIPPKGVGDVGGEVKEEAGIECVVGGKGPVVLDRGGFFAWMAVEVFFHFADAIAFDRVDQIDLGAFGVESSDGDVLTIFIVNVVQSWVSLLFDLRYSPDIELFFIVDIILGKAAPSKVGDVAFPQSVDDKPVALQGGSFDGKRVSAIPLDMKFGEICDRSFFDLDLVCTSCYFQL